ncbi:MAG: DUF4124 domain-containing protein [Gammaproteobacteria bacterium]|nr:MAG: DUF4124 domain-containing protein [Gammaproteobacteria bacterium]
MYISKRNSPILITLLFCVVTLPVYAGAVHKWVDAQGVTHYSDQLPENTLNTVKQIDVSNVYSNSASRDYQSTAYQENYYSVTNQWARMKEERLERKQLQLEKAKQKAAQQPVVPQVVYLNQAEEYRPGNAYYPAYFGHRGNGYKYHNQNNHYAGRKRGGAYSSRFTDRYSRSNCRLPRNGYSRPARSGITLTIR